MMFRIYEMRESCLTIIAEKIGGKGQESKETQGDREKGREREKEWEKGREDELML